jgi:hypothetical protein
MSDPTERFKRADVRARTERDLGRLRRRGRGPSFLRSMALIGSVGWPIVLLATGGALAGHHLDARWGTGVRFTFLLVFIGTGLGSALAFRSVRGGRA